MVSFWIFGGVERQEPGIQDVSAQIKLWLHLKDGWPGEIEEQWKNCLQK